jgi:MYXO-CTERM domain-containing protein
MLTAQSRTQGSRRRTAFALAAGVAAAAATLLPTAAEAHFALQEPACYSAQNILGDPQKSEPCGQADPGNPLKETGAVTTYRAGQKITLSIKETIFHPGHYRVSLAKSIADLPKDPPVMPDMTSPCGSTPIVMSPKLPLLADGVLPHTKSFTGPQTVQIQLPADFTCTKCTLQVAQFMSNHALNNPGGCFYHHCATVTILPADTDGGTPQDAGTGGDAGSGDPGSADLSGEPDPEMPPTGCGCRVGASPSSSAAPLFGFLALGSVLLARRRRISARARAI